MTRAQVLVSICAFAMTAAAAQATAVPLWVPVQGVLKTEAGGPTPDGNYGLLIKLYDGPGAGAATLWSQVEFATKVQAGIFSVTLGQGVDGPGQLPENLFASQPSVWLGVTVAGEAELPRQQLLSVPFAIRAQTAQLAEKATLADVATKASLADKATVAEKAALADMAEEAKSSFLAEKAKTVACTGCVNLEQVADAVLAAGNHKASWAGQNVSVQIALDDAAARLAVYEGAVAVNGGKVGVGVADPKCGLDVAEVCQSGRAARLVVDAKDEQDMLSITTPGAVVYRADDASFWGRTGQTWRKVAFVSVCGDQLVELAEECDDGNQINTDACTNTCKKAACGDSLVHAGVEACDDGNDDDTDGCVQCKLAKCGDGVVQSGVEVCDGANLAGQTCASQINGGGTLACSADCKSFDTSGCSDTTWMLTTDTCGGFRMSTWNVFFRFAVSASTTWDKNKKYGCPAGYRWATTAEGTAAFNGPNSGTYTYYNQCGWSNYVWNGGTRYYFRFSDSAQTDAYKHAGNYDPYQVQYSASTTNFAGIVCIKN